MKSFFQKLSDGPMAAFGTSHSFGQLPQEGLTSVFLGTSNNQGTFASEA